MTEKLIKLDLLSIRLQTPYSPFSSSNKFTRPYLFTSVFESLYVKVTFYPNKISSLMKNIKDNYIKKENLSFEKIYD